MSEIDDKVAALGTSFVGSPLTVEQSTSDGQGSYRHYQLASIFHHPAVGAHEVHGAIREKVRALAGAADWGDWTVTPIEIGGQLGYPTTDEEDTPDRRSPARVSHFQGASVYWTPETGAHEVHGAIGTLWKTELVDDLGYPISDEQWEPVEDPTVTPYVRHSEFENGWIYWDPGQGAFEVHRPPQVACEPRLTGRWETPIDAEVVGVHAALLHTNEVLFWSYEDPGHHEWAPQEFGEWSLLGLATGEVRSVRGRRDPNLFCAGQSQLADGRIFVGGGERGSLRNNRAQTIFDPESGDWTSQAEMELGRWYPTCVTLPDGKVILLAGDDAPEGAVEPPRWEANPTFEIFDPAMGMSGSRRPFDRGFIRRDETANESTYPFAYVLPGGSLFTHVANRTRIVDLHSLDFHRAIKPTTNRSVSRTYAYQGTSVLLPLDAHDVPAFRARVMVVGGAGASATIRTPATATTEMLDLGPYVVFRRLLSPLLGSGLFGFLGGLLDRVLAGLVGWRYRRAMHYPRVMPDAVLLPDGKVFVSSGSRAGYADHGADPAYVPEIYDPATDQWAEMCPMTIPRLYHSTAILLPDARVLVAGSDLDWNPPPFDVAQTQVEIFNPPYLFSGPRPQITEAPREMGYGGRFAVSVTGVPRIRGVSLVRLGSATHSFNSDQRLLKLKVLSHSPLAEVLAALYRPLPSFLRRVFFGRWFEVLQRKAGDTSRPIQVAEPPDAYVAPPGYYMLFAISEQGVPSQATFVRMG